MFRNFEKNHVKFAVANLNFTATVSKSTIIIKAATNLVYTCTYISLISMTNKSKMTFFLLIKYLSVSVCYLG